MKNHLQKNLRPDNYPASAAEAEGLHTLSPITKKYNFIPLGVKNGLTKLALSGDGKLLAAVGYDHFIRIFDTQSRLCIAFFEDQNTIIYNAVFSPDGSLLTTFGSDNKIKIWILNTDNPAYEYSLGKTGFPISVALAFSPFGRKLAFTNPVPVSTEIIIWEYLCNGTTHLTNHQNTGIYSLAFTPDGKKLFAGRSNYIEAWDIQTSTYVTLQKEYKGFEFNAGQINVLEMSPDGKRLASCDSVSGIDIWDIHTNIFLHNLRNYGHYYDTVNALSFSADSDTIVSGNDNGDICIWNLKSNKEIRTSFHGHTDSVRSVFFSADQKTIISGGEDNLICFWDRNNKKCKSVIEGGLPSGINTVSISPVKKIMALGIPYYGVQIWDYNSYLPVNPLKITEGKQSYHDTMAIIDPSGKYLATSCPNDGLKLWELSDFKCIAEMAKYPGILSMAFSPDGSRLAASHYYNSKISVWNIHSKQETVFYEELQKPSNQRNNSIAFSPDGKVLASIIDQSVWFWELNSGKCFKKYKSGSGSIGSICFSPSGKQLAFGNYSQICLLSIYSDDLNMINLPVGGSVNSLLFAEDGNTLIAGRSAGEIEIWDLTTFQIKKVLNQHGSEISSIAIEPGFNLLITSARNAYRIPIKKHISLCFWSIKTYELMAVFHPLKKGYMFVIPPDTYFPEGIFWTNRPELITVFCEKPDGTKEIVLGAMRDRYILSHNRKQEVQARLQGHPEEYERLAQKSQSVIKGVEVQNRLKYFHQMALMENIAKDESNIL